ncbi:MAG TPA: hypothetical protein VE987_08240 [Polyangiaceae bacterium]|nr:hypothetical protein [Polyangiaceae bacterium]
MIAPCGQELALAQAVDAVEPESGRVAQHTCEAVHAGEHADAALEPPPELLPPLDPPLLDPPPPELLLLVPPAPLPPPDPPLPPDDPVAPLLAAPEPPLPLPDVLPAPDPPDDDPAGAGPPPVASPFPSAFTFPLSLSKIVAPVAQPMARTTDPYTAPRTKLVCMPVHARDATAGRPAPFGAANETRAAGEGAAR